jgi:beta-glucosidase
VAAGAPTPGHAARPAFRFPPGFLWGAATAAHQVEGNNINSDCWLLETLPGTPFKERSGDACDHYHRYDQDIALLAKLGLNTYRFSVEWARIEPEPGMFSAALLAHYGRMLDSCHRHGIRTMVTLQHFTVPKWFAAQGGFENPEAPTLFARYARRVVEAVGDRIDWLCTINEANLSFGSHEKVREAAAKALNTPYFSTFLFSDIAKSKPIVHKCHAAARLAIKSVRPSLPVGYTLAMDDVQGTPDATDIASRNRSFMYDVWLKGAREDDFLGVQNYTRTLIGRRGPVTPPAEVKRTQVGQEYYPEALGGAVRYAAQVARVPIVVTESGLASEDDTLRIQYINRALASLAAAMADGVNVKGYVHWSLMDNFEWEFGYGPKFGLITVDRATQIRTPKRSAFHYGRIARASSISS